eukprot:3506493-Pyramimonas_sp.AAC.1
MGMIRQGPSGLLVKPSVVNLKAETTHVYAHPSHPRKGCHMLDNHGTPRRRIEGMFESKEPS